MYKFTPVARPDKFTPVSRQCVFVFKFAFLDASIISSSVAFGHPNLKFSDGQKASHWAGFKEIEMTKESDGSPVPGKCTAGNGCQTWWQDLDSDFPR